MGKVKLLLDVIEDIRSLADSLEAVADAMTHSDPPAAEPEVPKAAPTPVNEDPAPTTKAMSKEELLKMNKKLNKIKKPKDMK